MLALVAKAVSISMSMVARIGQPSHNTQAGRGDNDGRKSTSRDEKAQGGWEVMAWISLRDRNAVEGVCVASPV